MVNIEEQYTVDKSAYTYSKTSSFFFLTILMIHHWSLYNHKNKFQQVVEGV